MRLPLKLVVSKKGRDNQNYLGAAFSLALGKNRILSVA